MFNRNRDDFSEIDPVSRCSNRWSDFMKFCLIIDKIDNSEKTILASF